MGMSLKITVKRITLKFVGHLKYKLKSRGVVAESYGILFNSALLM